MEIRLPIRSTAGNRLLLGLGVGFILAAVTILAWAVVSTWGYAGFTERALQIVLLGCAAFGGFLALGAWRNLRGAPPRLRRQRA